MDELNLTYAYPCFSPAISLILLAYTNRFLSYAQLVRTLKEQYLQNHSEITAAQIDNLRKRLYLTRSMQVLGISSLFFCVVAMLSDLHRSARPLSIYLRTGSPAAHRFLGNIHLGNPYFRQGT